MAAFCTTPLLAIALYVLAARCVAADVTAGTPADAATSPVASQFHSTLSWAPCGDVATQGHCCAETRVSVTSTDALQISVQVRPRPLPLVGARVHASRCVDRVLCAGVCDMTPDERRRTRPRIFLY